MVDIVPRAHWGARYRAGFGARKLPTSQAWLHHSVTLAPDLDFRDLNADSVDDDEAAAMHTIERIGQQRFGAGFSYNLATMPSGRVYEGCGIARIGAHTKGRNTASMGIVLVGNYERDPVPDTMVDGLVDLLRHLHTIAALDDPRFDGGHRDVGQTSCPGKYAYRLIPDINRRAAVPATQEDEDMSEVVEGIQRALTSAGGDPGPVDGVWGPRTEGALATALQHAAVSEERDRFFEAMHRDLKAKGARPSSLGHMLTWYRELREQHPTVPPPGPS